MNYIDKSQNIIIAHSLINGFLSEVQRQNGGKYPNDLYVALRSAWHPPYSKNYYQLITASMLSEQHGLCCYCMRKLTHANITREHIIPHSTTDQVIFDSYITPQNCLNANNVMLEKKFLQSNYRLPVKTFPHTIAYENIILSCDGKCYPNSNSQYTCNNKRGDLHIPILPYIQNIRYEIKYCTNGFMLWVKDRPINKIGGVIANLGLNNRVLRMYRKIWYYLSFNKLSLSTINKDEVINEIAGQLVADSDELALLYTFKHENKYWDTLADYSYFNNSNLFT